MAINGYQVEDRFATKAEALACADSLRAQVGCIRAGVKMLFDDWTHPEYTAKPCRAYGVFAGECPEWMDGCRRVSLVGNDERRALAIA